MANPDCTRKCRYRSHALTITAAITKRSVADEALAKFLALTCSNFANNVDDLGRSAVHMAASVGRYGLCEWLINQGGVMGRDFESGSTPLHRAVYYGCIDCAVLLLRYGAQLADLDEDCYCPLQNVCRFRNFPHLAENVAINNEILVWGSNKNYNLGLGNEEGSELPQSVDFFRKQHICIESVALGHYHSLFLRKSQLFAVGHGKGGRLGINVEDTLVTPKKVKVPIKNAGEVIIGIAVSRHHSLVLTNRSVVFACGLNGDYQLGIREAGEKLTAFKEVTTLRDLGVDGLLRVIACDHYSLTYSLNSIYVWGTNTGQFGMDAANNKTVALPKLLKLPERTVISFVEANNAAVAVAARGSIILLYNGKTRTLKTPQFEAAKSLSLSGGDNPKSAKGTATALKLMLLTQTNVIYLWYEIKQSFYRCFFSNIERLTNIDRIFYKGNQMLILSQGDVYRGKCNQVPVPACIAEDELAVKNPKNLVWLSHVQNRIDISSEYMVRIDLQRIANIDRAVDIFCDADFGSFAALQESSYKYFKLPTLTAEEYTFKKLYNDINESDDLCDVVFNVDGETFAAHKLLVYARAPGLRRVIDEMDSGDKRVHLDSENLTGKMFELMLKHVYTNYLPNEDDIDDIHTSLGPTKSPMDNAVVCRLFFEHVEKFHLNNLANYLKSFLEQSPFCLPGRADKAKYRFNRLHPCDFPALHDVRIICADAVELPAHKCVLVTRLEYFEMMFTHSWQEQAVINLSTVPVEYMKPILEFLYTADVEQFRRQCFSETYLYNMIVFCDQFFIERLRKVCEISILDKITIRKCGDMLEFACMYNCTVLKRGCMDFICQNLARVLSFRCLEQCDAETLHGLNAHYRQLFKDVFDYRVITPDADAIDDALLLSLLDDNITVDLNYRMDAQLAAKAAAAKQKPSENKSNLINKQYEREAISSMKESLQRNDERVRHDSEVNAVLTEAHAVAEKLQAEAKNWMKVVDKKDVAKKRQSLELALKANEAIKAEEKPKAALVSLTAGDAVLSRAAKTPEREQPGMTTNSDVNTPVKAYISLADFTPSREKLSQKQRKRQSSTGEGATAAVVAVRPATAAETLEQPNAWGVMSQSPPIGATACSSFPAPPTGSMADTSSFANMMRTGGTRQSHADDGSFSRILAEERKQRDDYDRMRHKSLALTQIEETAIAELRDFYNVNNVVDEIITIERKARPATMNFAVWQRR